MTTPNRSLTSAHHCPNCSHTGTVIVSYRFNNGSAQSIEYRCPECGHHWETNRQGVPRTLYRGWTPAQTTVRRAVLRFAIEQHAYTVLGLNTTP